MFAIGVAEVKCTTAEFSPAEMRLLKNVFKYRGVNYTVC